MTGGGNDANPNHRNPNAGCATWGVKNSSLNINSMGTATSDGPSPMYTQSYVYTEGSYTGKPPSQVLWQDVLFIVFCICLVSFSLFCGVGVVVGELIVS
jgi:hypothetical protein